jgi:hypothetical protein
MAPYHSPIKRHVSTVYSSTCPANNAYHVNSTMSACMVKPRHLYGLYGLPSQRPFFFLVWRFEQIVISLAPDVCLRRNELLWVCNDETYAHIRFEAIPRTLIFELKFDPWSRFGSHLPTERILDPQNLMIIYILSSSIN